MTFLPAAGLTSHNFAKSKPRRSPPLQHAIAAHEFPHVWTPRRLRWGWDGRQHGSHRGHHDGSSFLPLQLIAQRAKRATLIVTTELAPVSSRWSAASLNSSDYAKRCSTASPSAPSSRGWHGVVSLPAYGGEKAEEESLTVTMGASQRWGQGRGSDAAPSPATPSLQTQRAERIHDHGVGFFVSMAPIAESTKHHLGQFAPEPSHSQELV